MSIFRSPIIRGHLPLVARERDNYDFFKEFEDLFNRNLASPEMSLPKVPMNMNIQESKEGYHIEAELPGVKREEIDISMKGDFLIIKGEKNSFNEENKDNYHRVERSHGSFYRSVQLPKDVEHDNIKASLQDGILKVDVMKSNAQDKGEKKIAIN